MLTPKRKKTLTPDEKLTKRLGNCTVPEGYSLSVKGVRQRETRTTISRTPFWKSGMVRNVDERDWRTMVTGRSRNGGYVTVELTSLEMHGRPSNIIARLDAEGLEMVNGCGQEVVKYLAAFGEVPHYIRPESTGWHVHPNGQNVFVLPNRVVGLGEGDAYDTSYLSRSELARGMTRCGKTPEWREHVALLVQGNPVLMFSIFVGLSSPLIWPLKAETGGFHLQGPSSTGKTTALLVATSVWGEARIGGTRPSAVLTWNTTANALEGTAASRCDITMALDEIGEFDGNNFGRLVYSLTAGQGKSRMNADTSLKPSARWRLCYLSTGERSVEEMLQGDGPAKPVHAGQMIRLLNIETENSIILDTHGEDSPGAYAERVQQACGEFYGAAGPLFVKKLIGLLAPEGETTLKTDELKRMLEKAESELAWEGMDGQQRRALKRFALAATAGLLAVRFKILPYTSEEVMAAVKSVVTMWASNTTPNDGLRAAIRLKEFIEGNLDRFADPRDDRFNLRDKVGMKRRIDGRDLFLFSSQEFQKACGVRNTKEVCHCLRSKGLLHCNNRDRFQSRFSPSNEVLFDDKTCGENMKSGKISVYAVEARILDWEGNAGPKQASGTPRAANG